MRNLHPIPNSEFEWIDYPGSVLINPGTPDFTKVLESINTSSCLLLIINGESFAVEAPDIDTYTTIVRQNFQRNGDDIIFNRLNLMAVNNIRIPPLAVVVTKRDLIPPERRDLIGNIIHAGFSDIFNSGLPVFVSSVTLGEGIEGRADASPQDVDKPIVYAVLSVLQKSIKDTKSRIEETERRFREKNTFWNRMFDSNILNGLQQKIGQDKQIAENLSRNARSMLDFFDNDCIFYEGGIRRNLRDFFAPHFTVI